jgi:lipopolysaccharide transport system permease protein
MASLWDYRGLIIRIALTDLKIRYKNSVLGFTWSMLQPLLMFAVIYIVFSNVFISQGIQIHDYQFFLLLGIIVWGFFDKATSFSLNSIIGKPTLVKKIYFPREVLVISACVTALAMTLLELVVYLLFMVIFRVTPSWTVAFLPVVLGIEFIFTIGVSLAIASLNVRYRDVQYIWAVLMQAGFFVTPIMYSLSILGDSLFSAGLRLNPMAVIMDMARGALIYNTVPTIGNMAFVIIIALAMVAAGWLIFSRLEPSFGEEV